MGFSIDGDVCTACGLCEADCPTGSIAQVSSEGPYQIASDTCIGCGHCAMVCPENAVRSDEPVGEPVDDGTMDYRAIGKFLKGRRSVRQYQRRGVSEELLRELLAEASQTSTGTNAQDWEATVLTGDAVERIGSLIARFWQRLIGLVGLPGVRIIAMLTQGRKYVADKESLAQNRARIASYFSGVDWLFWHAPAVVMLTYPKANRRLGVTNCVLAGARVMNLAMSMGLGTCMIGFSTIAVNTSRTVRRECGIAESRRVGLTFTIGYPDVRYLRLPNRKAMPTTFIT